MIFRDLLNDIIRQWKVGLACTFIVLLTLGLGIYFRPGFVGSVTYDIGGILDVPLEVKNNVKFFPFENDSQLENLFSNNILPSMQNNARNACVANAEYSPDGYKLKLTCKSGGREQLRRMIADVSQPFLDRHHRLFQRATLIEEHRMRSLTRRAEGAEQQINVLKLDATSGLAKARQIELEVVLAELRDELSLDGILGERVTATRMAPSGVMIIDRQPSPSLWLSVVLLSLGVGAFSALLTARAILSEHR